ncbi:stage VI sporulation protein F [Paenibacillus apiarius]|uniref:Stage VI sporulation protein F n=1 Tax=Paenibacillus apiarius TaxID=46240 RepID=A0ABT4DTQ0_9BACL|nr:stage VI sporulation protein F [Paenibacillus apiarius]MBN3527645.1 stage VI sporulation protein F [Paenibacillus apiarius]MCY9517133.1 stage VI sporulation protein F [Paenibacillus apiarius]MCY9520170.1 stage VI sporulation protein F [Paenibacillus apiarius]MCY9554942.1 stage VI sporulation protein F [Paenibacillus apiarius]MCY9561453.1 stage VI sporulation protein F [Paenibacillus apiarius]
MPNNKFSKDALNAINKKTGKRITENQIKKIAGGVKPSTMQSEAQLRQLIKQVASMAKLPVTEATINEIVSTVKRSGTNPSNLESIMKMIMKK